MSRQHDREALPRPHRTNKPPDKPPPLPEPDEDVRSSVGNEGLSKLLQPGVSATIEAELGGGRPLSETPAAQLAKSDGRQVRIHDDGTAADLSRELGAVAFTFGRDIFLSGGAPDLRSNDGQAMLRHELTHVDQQAQGGTTRPLRVSSPESPAEQQAARAQQGDVGGTTAAATGAVHRQEEQEEEELLMMRDDTVHRQEEQEEEELLMMRDDTVHRQVAVEEELDEEAASAEGGSIPGDSPEEAAAESSNPALAALYEGTVLSNHRAAIDALRERPRRARAAMDAIHQAADGVMALVGVYRDSDPRLYERLGKYYNALIVSWTQLSAVVDGPAPVADIADLLASDNSLGLGESLQAQLH